MPKPNKGENPIPAAAAASGKQKGGGEAAGGASRGEPGERPRHEHHHRDAKLEHQGETASHQEGAARAVASIGFVYAELTEGDELPSQDDAVREPTTMRKPEHRAAMDDDAKMPPS
ncbi:unnamed protein product [Urochloa humidicola]